MIITHKAIFLWRLSPDRNVMLSSRISQRATHHNIMITLVDKALGTILISAFCIAKGVLENWDRVTDS
jgi:hypothetical protein